MTATVPELKPSVAQACSNDAPAGKNGWMHVQSDGCGKRQVAAWVAAFEHQRLHLQSVTGDLARVLHIGIFVRQHGSVQRTKLNRSRVNDS